MTRDGGKPTPIVLVATKLDLRNHGSETGEPCTRTEEGATYAREIKAHSFIECSAKENVNIDNVFQAAIKAHLNPKNSDGGCCDDCCVIA